MKKIVFILSSLFCLNGFSQLSFVVTNMANSATVAPNEVIDLITTASADITNDFDIKNISSSNKSYNIKRYDMVLHSAGSATASAYFCFAGNCFPDVTTQAGPLTLTPGQKATDVIGSNEYLTTDLQEISTVGASLVKYTFINASNAADSLQFSLRYNSNVLGIAAISANALSSLELFPNPATDVTVLKVNSQKAMDAKVIIYNALGAVVSEMPVAILEGKNKIDLDVNQLSSGIYFAQIKMANSTVTKKLVIK